METSLVTLQMNISNVGNITLSLGDISDDGSIGFYVLFANVSKNTLKINNLFINSDNTITSSMSEYALTPAT